MSTKNTNISQFKDIKLLDTQKSTKNKQILTSFGDIWNEILPDQLLYICFFKRFGSIYSKYSALDLTQIFKKIEKRNEGSLKIIGICSDESDLDTFKSEKVFPFDIYIDNTKQLYNAFNFKKESFWDCYSNCSKEKQIKELEAKARYKNFNLKNTNNGNKFQLGGSLIINRWGEVLFEYIDSFLGDHPTELDILEIVENQIE